MSQHLLATTRQNGEEVVVMVGYDRPLDYVHCLVTNAESGETLYSNLGDPDAGTFQPDIRYYTAVLDSLGIQLPEVMYKQVEADAAGRAGNRFVRYAPDGSILEELGQ